MWWGRCLIGVWPLPSPHLPFPPSPPVPLFAGVWARAGRPTCDCVLCRQALTRWGRARRRRRRSGGGSRRAGSRVGALHFPPKVLMHCNVLSPPCDSHRTAYIELRRELGSLTGKRIKIGVGSILAQFYHGKGVNLGERGWTLGFSAGLPLSHFTPFPGKGVDIGVSSIITQFCQGKGVNLEERE